MSTPSMLTPEQISLVSRVLDRLFSRQGSPSDLFRRDAAEVALHLFGLGIEDEEELLAQLEKAMASR